MFFLLGDLIIVYTSQIKGLSHETRGASYTSRSMQTNTQQLLMIEGIEEFMVRVSCGLAFNPWADTQHSDRKIWVLSDPHS